MPRLEVQIHQVKRDPGLQIPLDPIDRHLLPYIQYPAKRNARLGDGLIDLFVRLDPALEVVDGLFLRHASIVRVARARLERNVGSDDFGIVAERFEE
jgi:hypothetical protein